MTNSNGRLTAKVAQILSRTDLVFNKGKEDGIEVGMKFAVLAPIKHEINDPDTGDLLGTVDIAKTVLKVVRVENKLAIARTFRSRQTGFSSIVLGLNGTKNEILKSDEERTERRFSDEDSKISRGDTAIQYTGEFDGVVLDF